MISSAVTLALEFPRQSIFSGVMQGLTYGVIAIGLILIYRSTQIINFAIVEMGAFAAALLARLVINWGVDYWVALPACVIAGGLLGAGVELVIVRRLFRSPRVVLFVATIGLAQLLLFFQFVLPKFDTYGAFPTAFSFTWEFQGLFIRSEHILVLVIVPLLAIRVDHLLESHEVRDGRSALRPPTPTRHASRRSVPRGCRRSCGRSQDCSRPWA